MNEERFWQMIEEAKGDADTVEARLKGLPAKEIDAWDEIYWSKHNALHRWDVWGAAYLINGGCSDDGFHYFKAFAIGKGRAFYEALAADPDSVGGKITEDDLEEGCDNESLNYVAQSAYQEVAGEELPSRSVEGDDPAGEPFDEDEDDLRDRFPKLFAKFGEA